MSPQEFYQKLMSFTEGCNKIIQVTFKDAPWTPDGTCGHKVTIEPGYQAGNRKFVKLVQNGQSKVFCFVEKSTGDVLMAASFSKPAKHARGNIFDEHNGLKYMQWTGPMYLEDIKKMIDPTDPNNEGRN